MDVKLSAAKHARDWLGRCDEYEAEEVEGSARTVTLRLDEEALRDLISDALYYSEEMSPENTGDIDYRGPARSCLAALGRAGVRWTRRPGTFTVKLDEVP